LVIAVDHPFLTVLVYLVSVELEGFEKEHGEVERAREWWNFSSTHVIVNLVLMELFGDFRGN
jgi:hypothetical protein